MSQTTFNNTTAYHDRDGSTCYVVNATNPGVADWLDSSGVTRGEIFARFENVATGANAADLAVTTQLVPVAEVGSYLPADSPSVSPQEYAADMAQRVCDLPQPNGNFPTELDAVGTQQWAACQTWSSPLRPPV